MNVPMRSGNYGDAAPLFAPHEAIPGMPFNPRDKSSKHFIAVPLWLFNRPEIPAQAALLYGLLIYKCHPKSGICKAGGSRKLADMMHFSSDKSVRNYLQILRENRLIRAYRDGPNTTNEYEFLIHEWMLESSV